MPRPLPLPLRALLVLLTGLVGAAAAVPASAVPASAVPANAVPAKAVPARAVPAERPPDLQEEVTDTVGALAGREDDVQAALDRLADETPYQLFVAFVDTFEGGTGPSWADATSVQSSLGDDDILLAVAVEERLYGFSVGQNDLTDDQLDEVEAVVEDHLRDDDWAGAAIAAADGFRAAAAGEPIGSEGTGGSGGAGEAGDGAGGGFPWLMLLLVGVAVLIIVLVVRSARRARAGGGGPAGVPTAELTRRAGSALVAIDDTIKDAEQELGFAQAQFGLEESRPFAAALAGAKERVGQAFAIRHQLDDATPEPEEQRRAMLVRVLELCDEAARMLGEQTAELERLRDLQRRAPEVLAETRQRADEVAARMPAARAALDRLAATYPEAALATVRGNADQAAALLEATRTGVGQAEAGLDTDRGTAVRLLRTAQGAVTQAAALLDAVDRAGRDLAEAGGRIDAAMASLGSDVADAERLARDDAAVRPPLDAARAALAAVPAERTAGDPLALLRRLGEAETALDAALAPLRAQAEQADRARQQLTALLARTTARIRAVEEFITTRRGAVGAEARTRLAEAARLAQEAEAQAATDPVSALGAAQRAEQLAVAAQQLAEADVARFQQGPGPGGPGAGGPFGGNAGALILGGILLDQVLGGGRGGFGGGGFGGGFPGGGRRSGGGFGGGFGGGGGRRSGGGSFGGGRGRRGGGGRF